MNGNLNENRQRLRQRTKKLLTVGCCVYALLLALFLASGVLRQSSPKIVRPRGKADPERLADWQRERAKRTPSAKVSPPYQIVATEYREVVDTLDVRVVVPAGTSLQEIQTWHPRIKAKYNRRSAHLILYYYDANLYNRTSERSEALIAIAHDNELPIWWGLAEPQ